MDEMNKITGDELQRLTDFIAEIISNLTEDDLNQLVSQRDRDELFDQGSAWIQHAVHAYRRENLAVLRAELATRKLKPREVQTGPYEELVKMVQDHLGSTEMLTLAARNGSGKISDQDVRSVVDDILDLKRG